MGEVHPVSDFIDAESGIEVEHREIAFDNKPPSMLEASPKGTVPTMVLPDGTVIDESWDVMQWALAQSDPDNWKGDYDAILEFARDLVDRNDNQFTDPAYYYRYADKYPDRDHEQDRDKAAAVIAPLEDRLGESRYLGGDRVSVADIPLFPFIDAFSKKEPEWFGRNYPNLIRWLEDIRNSNLYRDVAVDHELWGF